MPSSPLDISISSPSINSVVLLINSSLLFVSNSSFKFFNNFIDNNKLFVEFFFVIAFAIKNKKKKKNKEKEKEEENKKIRDIKKKVNKY